MVERLALPGSKRTYGPLGTKHGWHLAVCGATCASLAPKGGALYPSALHSSFPSIGGTWALCPSQSKEEKKVEKKKGRKKIAVVGKEKNKQTSKKRNKNQPKPLPG